MMKHCFMFLLGIFLSAVLCGQNYSSEVVFLQQQGNTLTVRALGISEKKKEAVCFLYLVLYRSGGCK